jgi:carbonic anhydrase
MRSLALACAVKGGREIAIIGHTDCQVCRTTTMTLLDKLKALGVERNQLPENLNEFFGMSGSERQNVIKACDFARNSPLIGPKLPVHGLMIDVETGRLDWVVNGYVTWQRQVSPVKNVFAPLADASNEEIGAGTMTGGFQFGEMKFPETKIGETSAKIGAPEIKPVTPAAPAIPPLPAVGALPPKIPTTPPIRPRVNWQQ